MLSTIKRAYRSAPIATVVLALSLVIALGFSVRMVADILDGPPPPKEVAIEAWMTPRYISKTWRIPPNVLGDLLDIEKRGGRPDNLENLASERGITVDDLIDQLEQDIQQHLDARQDKRDRK